MHRAVGVARGLARAEVDGEQRQQAERDDRHRDLGAGEDDGREREHADGGDELEGEVAQQVAADGLAGEDRGGDAGEDVVDDEEGDAGRGDGAELLADRGERQRGAGEQRGGRGGGDREHVLRGVEGDLQQRQARGRVGDDGGGREGDGAGERAEEEDRGEREGRRGGDPVEALAARDVDRQQLAQEDDAAQHEQAPVPGGAAREAEQRQRGHAAGRDGQCVATERAGHAISRSCARSRCPRACGRPGRSARWSCRAAVAVTRHGGGGRGRRRRRRRRRGGRRQGGCGSCGASPGRGRATSEGNGCSPHRSPGRMVDRTSVQIGQEPLQSGVPAAEKS